MNILKTITILSLLSIFSYAKTNLLFYCGTTMVKPMLEIAKVIEKKYDCKITIVQGGSRDLFESIKIAQTGDLFRPGNSDYIEQYHNEGYFEYERQIGYNQLAIFVSKGNPQHIQESRRFSS